VTGDWDDQCKLIREALGRETLENETRRILAAEMVQEVLSVELWSRMPDGADTIVKGQPTILIVARWIDESRSAVWAVL
jgi:hypothetical protein